MIFYRIHLKGVPKIKYALLKGVSFHTNYFSKLQNYIEVCLVDDGAPTQMISEENSYVAEKGMLLGIVQDMVVSAQTREESVHRCIGVNVEYEEQRFDSTRLSEQKLNEIIELSKNDGEFLVPIGVSMDETLTQVKTLMRKITTAHHSRNTGKWAESVSGWFELMALLTRFTVVRLLSEKNNLSPTQYRYVEKIKQYVQNHTAEKITVQNIAQSLSVSEGYAHRIFKNATGQTLTAYINGVKLNTAAEYIKKYNTTAKDAAKSVGIDDSLYFCRLFKKYYGITVSAFRKSVHNDN